MNNSVTTPLHPFLKAQVSASEQNFRSRLSDYYSPSRIIRNRHQAEVALIARHLPKGTQVTPDVIENSLIALHLDWATREAVNAAETTDPFERAYHRRNAEREYHKALSILELPKHRHTNAPMAHFLRHQSGDPRWTFFKFGRCDRCGIRLAGKRSLHLPNAGLHFCAQCGRLEMDAFEAHRAEEFAIARANS